MDPIALSGLIVGAIGTVAAVVGAVAAVLAARYAKASPSKEDLARVERFTAETAQRVDIVRIHAGETAQHIDAVRGHLAGQEQRELLVDRAASVSITVTAGGYGEEPLLLTITFTDPNVRLLRIDLINRLTAPVGTVTCSQVAPLRFSAELSASQANKWFNEGAVSDSASSRLVEIRAALEIEGTQTNKKFTATMWRNSQPKPDSPNVWVSFHTLNGGC